MDLYWNFVAFLGKLYKPIEDALWAGKRKSFLRSMPGYTLYYFQVSNNAYRVRKAIRDLGLDIAMKDVLLDPKAHEELMRGGGRDRVPCLRIEDASGTRWMYESRDIVRFLEERAGRDRTGGSKS